MKMKNTKGFTLLEILLVVAAIGILAGIVIVALNPGKQLGDTRNAQRRSDVTTILNAVYQYSLDNNGNLPTGIDVAPAKEICKTGGACTGLADVSVITDSGKYIVGLPMDPSGGSENGTGYFIVKDANGRVTVSAPQAEQGVIISASK
jgi:prepilin-type N-terminal cleavage/methylation domain-containing protein